MLIATPLPPGCISACFDRGRHGQLDRGPDPRLSPLRVRKNGLVELAVAHHRYRIPSSILSSLLLTSAALRIVPAASRRFESVAGLP
jgi:hypothetical protein